MSHQSGIAVPSDVEQQWHHLRDDKSTGFVMFEIKDEAYAISSVGKTSGSEDDRSRLAATAKALPAKTPAFAAVRQGDKWLLVFYVPAGCKGVTRGGGVGQWHFLHIPFLTCM